jgi:phosphatidate cytidylyltransferase
MDDKLHRERPPDPSEGVRIIGADETDESKESKEPPGKEPQTGGKPPTPPPGESSMPHWTEPGTGEVPRIFAEGEENDEDLNAWASFGSSQPRWRGEGTGVEAEEVDDFSGLASEDTRLGALDPSAPDPGFFTFDDLEGDPRREAGPPAGEAGAAVPPAAPDSPEPEPMFSPPTARPITSDPRRTTTTGRGPTAAPYERPPAGPRDMQTAIVVGVGFAAVALLLFWLGPRYTMFLVTAVILLAAAEFFNAVRRHGQQPATLLGIAACVGLVLGAYWKGPAALPLVLFLAVVFTLVWYLWGLGGPEHRVTGIGVTLFGICYVGVLGSFAALLLQQPHGVGLLLGAVVPAVAYDIGGLVVGRYVGRSPLSAISPSKTWEGLAGGVILTVLAAVLILGLLPGVHPWDDFYTAFRLGVAIAVVAPIGDLCESMIKRDMGLKDMGELLPGHGGLLDRFDAILFALPTTYYVANLVF